MSLNGQSAKNSRNYVSRTLGEEEPLSSVPPDPVPTLSSPAASTANSDREREPLLPQRDFVSPDDPIVSPLNLFKIRILRIVSILVLIINIFLFFVFLLSDFVSIPGLDSKGASFLDLDVLAILGLSNLLTLWCFDVPAYFERIIGYVIAGFLGFDLLVVTISRLSSQYFGITAQLLLIWAFANFLFNSLVDYWVYEGRKYQEIKYTGREETRRSVGELFVIFIKSLVKLFIALLIGAISVTIWVQCYDLFTKPWGDLVPVDNDSFKVHLSCYGVSSNITRPEAKQPIVLVEGGQLTSSESTQIWVEELFHLNKIESYCIWDRPGYGFSDNAPSPLSIGITNEYLNEALRNKGISGPFALVGFDIGGLYSRLYAAKYPGSVHSLLLVDSWHEDLLLNNPFKYVDNDEDFSSFKNILEPMDRWTGFKLWLRGMASPFGIISNLHWLIHPRKYTSKSRIFGKDMIYSLKYLKARLQEEITSAILSHYELVESDLHDVPMSVISSDFMIKNSATWGLWQRQLTKLSANALEWVVAESSDHWIWESAKGKKQLQDLLIRLVGEIKN